MDPAMSYFDQLCRAMRMLGRRSDTVFMGQGVAYPSTSMSATFHGVPDDKKMEMPVAEELQCGMAIGMSLQGILPICVFPRWNFMLRAADQIVNHLDRLPIYSKHGFMPRVIIRTAVPSISPFNPQAQHDDDFTEAFRLMFRTIKIECLKEADDIVPAYHDAMRRNSSTVIVEYTDRYRNQRGA